MRSDRKYAALILGVLGSLANNLFQRRGIRRVRLNRARPPKHPLRPVPAEFLKNCVTRQQVRAALRANCVQFVNEAHGVEVRGVRRSIALAKARNMWKQRAPRDYELDRQQIARGEASA